MRFRRSLSFSRREPTAKFVQAPCSSPSPGPCRQFRRGSPGAPYTDHTISRKGKIGATICRHVPSLNAVRGFHSRPGTFHCFGDVPSCNNSPLIRLITHFTHFFVQNLSNIYKPVHPSLIIFYFVNAMLQC